LKVSVRGAQVALTLFVLFVSVAVNAGDAPLKAPAPPPDDRLARLIAHIQPQPLALIASPDLKVVPERFTKTFLHQMIQDPSYVQGRDTLRALINQKAGADLPALWPDFARHLSGPVVIALVPSKKDERGAPPFSLALYALVASADAAAKLREFWPKLPPQNPAFFSSTQLITVLEADLAPATPRTLPVSTCDVLFLIRPKALGVQLKTWFGAGGESVALDNLAIILSEVHDDAVESMTLATTFNGGYFDEELSVEIKAPVAESSLARVVSVLKEKPGAWNALRMATPGEQDVVLLLQTDPAALGDDKMYLGQALERDLRGRRWIRTHGRMEESLNPQRYDALTGWMQGSFAIVAKPAISGDIRVTLLAAMKNAAEADFLREGLRTDFAKLGAEFDTLAGARKIGDSAPLGAKFEGRGLFGSPVIGISPGWMWLCSNLATYQDLTAAFKARKTLSVEAWKEDEFPWQPQDAVRMQVQLERVLKIAYAAWLLSGEEGPYAGPWKIPGELLPQPQVFTNRLGVLQGTLLRTEKGAGARTHSAFPAMPFLMFSGLLEMANRLESARAFTRAAKEDLKVQKNPDAEPKPGVQP